MEQEPDPGCRPDGATPGGQGSLECPRDEAGPQVESLRQEKRSLAPGAWVGSFGEKIQGH